MCCRCLGFLLATIQLSLAFLLNFFAVLAWLYVFFNKQPKWLFEMQESEMVSFPWYLVPYWLWPVSTGEGGRLLGGGFTAAEAAGVRPTLMLAAINHKVHENGSEVDVW